MRAVIMISLAALCLGADPPPPRVPLSDLGRAIDDAARRQREHDAAVAQKKQDADALSAAQAAETQREARAVRAQKDIDWKAKYGVPYHLDLMEIEPALRETSAIPTAFQASYYPLTVDDPEAKEFDTRAQYVVRSASVAGARRDDGGDMPTPRILVGTFGGRPVLLAIQPMADGTMRRLGIALLANGRAQVWDCIGQMERADGQPPAVFCQLGR